MPDGMTHASDSGVEFMAPVPGASFWSVCRWLNVALSAQTQQDAQLSQRDRAAGCVIVFAKSRKMKLGDNILRTSIFNQSDMIGLKICRIP